MYDWMFSEKLEVAAVQPFKEKLQPSAVATCKFSGELEAESL